LVKVGYLTETNILRSLEIVSQAMNSAKDVEHIIDDVLDAVLTMFGCDRIWLFHPCDPNTDSFKVLAEKNKPEYPGAFASGEEIPINAEASETIRKALVAGSPVVFGPESENKIDDVAARFSVLSQMIMAIHTKTGKPWMLGMHQCAFPRVWTEDEQLLFKEISFRVVEGLNNLILLKDLKASHERFRTVLDSLDSLVYVADMDTYELLYINKYGREKWGKISGRICWQSLQSGQAGPCAFCTNDRLIAKDGTPTDPYIWEFRNTVDNEWYECRDQAIRWLDGRVVRMEIATNITQRKLAEEQKAVLEEKLRQALKMEAIGTLAGGIAHDFNNILGAILGYTELARASSSSFPEIYGKLDKVIQAGQRAKDLVRQILTFSRQSATEHIALHPASLVAEAVKMLRSTLPATIDIVLKIDPKAGPVAADPTQIHQILMNLCTNAFHAMEHTGGRLDIMLKETTLSASNPVEESGTEAGKYVQLSICDTGTGIDPENKDKIFDPYFTTKEAGKGTGMGLAVTHGIVKSYGGVITIDSEPGKGTTVHVFFPRIDADAVLENNEAELIPGGGERILFIDDEEMLTTLNKVMLEELGYKVTASCDSREALRIYQQQPDQFDLVITDQTMPGLTGAELAAQMLQIRPDLPIILCTGYSSIISRDEAKSMGIRSFAAKPLGRREMAMLIRKSLNDRP
jgi:signal transduction histidine kinase/ActR/RegA family two-component response regulator